VFDFSIYSPLRAVQMAMCSVFHIYLVVSGTARSNVFDFSIYSPLRGCADGNVFGFSYTSRRFGYRQSQCVRFLAYIRRFGVAQMAMCSIFSIYSSLQGLRRCNVFGFSYISRRFEPASAICLVFRIHREWVCLLSSAPLSCKFGFVGSLSGPVPFLGKTKAVPSKGNRFVTHVAAADALAHRPAANAPKHRTPFTLLRTRAAANRAPRISYWPCSEAACHVAPPSLVSTICVP